MFIFLNPDKPEIVEVQNNSAQKIDPDRAPITLFKLVT
jgi:hypothetical protein